jgi:hypothetical protein
MARFYVFVVVLAEKKGDAVVSVKEEGGMLKAHGTKDVVFSITPHDTGRQTYNISVMNMKTMTPVRVYPDLHIRRMSLPLKLSLRVSLSPANRECHLERGEVAWLAVPGPACHRYPQLPRLFTATVVR